MYSQVMIVQICISLFLTCRVSYGQDWPPPNTIDLIRQRMDAITADKCETASVLELRLPADTLSHLPTYQQLSQPDYTVPDNRSQLVLLHNLALSKAFFFSFINNRLNESFNFLDQPDWLYYYMSVFSDVAMTTNMVNDGAVFYDQNMTYANWMELLEFNRTLGLFGPRVWRDPECNIPDGIEGDSSGFCESVNGMLSTDYGAGENNNYTTPDYKHNPWYDLFLPDDDPAMDYMTKNSYTVELKYANQTESQFLTFFGVALPETVDDFYQPVEYTVPYFDCGKSNKWIVGAVSPFVDRIPRYLEWQHLRRDIFTGVSVLEMDYEEIDINPCPLSLGNEAPNYFAGTAMCKSTTWCEPLPGYGFQRGGYQCICNDGLVYPTGQDGPFQGVDIENSTRLEYEMGFDCVEPDSDTVQIKPHKQRKPKEQKHSKFVPRYNFKHLPNKEHYNPFHTPSDHLNSFLYYTRSMTLPKEFAYNAEEQFKLQSYMAVRLSHFLSSYLQTASPLSPPHTHRQDDLPYRSDKHFSVDHVYGETLAVVMGDTSISGCGVYFDEDKFISNDEGPFQYFAPYASSKNINTSNEFAVIDAAEHEPLYTEEEWFLELRERWQNGTVGLTAASLDLEVRTDINGDNVTSHPYSTVTYYAAALEDGIWVNPYFKCDRRNDWMLTYAIPFFGLDKSGGAVEFHGAVTVDILLDDLAVDQCDESPLNAFGSTAKCNTQTSKCVNLGWNRLQLGGYRCVCLADSQRWVEGQTLEAEYQKMVQNQPNSFHELRNIC